MYLNCIEAAIVLRFPKQNLLFKFEFEKRLNYVGMYL